MSISTVNITSDIEGDYTLAELLALLGSPKDVKTALAKLEAKSKQIKASVELAEVSAKESEKKLAIKWAEFSNDRAELKRDLLIQESDQGTLANKQEVLDDKSATLNIIYADKKEKSDILKGEQKALNDKAKKLDEREVFLNKTQDATEKLKAEYEDKLEKIKAVVG